PRTDWPRMPSMPRSTLTLTSAVTCLAPRRSSIAFMRRISTWALVVSTSTDGSATFADSLSSRSAARIMPRVNLESSRVTSGSATRFDKSSSCLSRPSADAAIFANTPDAASVALTTYSIDAISPPAFALSPQPPRAPAFRPRTGQPTRSAPPMTPRSGALRLSSRGGRRGRRRTGAIRRREIPHQFLLVVFAHPGQAGGDRVHPVHRRRRLVPELGDVGVGEQAVPVVVDAAPGDQFRPHVRRVHRPPPAAARG